MKKEWYVYYTKSRWEKKIKKYLIEREYEVFLPQHKVMRQWSDRKKKVEVPLFNSYIFVRSNENEIHDVLQIPGIVKNLKYNGAPAVLHEKEYQAINGWLSTGLMIEVEGLSDNFEVGEKVKVLGGAFKGLEGEIRRVDDDTCCLILNSIQQVLKINIRKELLSV